MHSVRSIIVSVVLSLALLLPNAVVAQDVASVRVYRDQFISLHDKALEALNRVKTLVSAGAGDRERLRMTEEFLAMQKLIYRLGEEATRSNLERLKQQRESSKGLLLIGQGCEELTFFVNALQNCIDTDDRAFLGLAVAANDLIVSLRKLL
jgi:hypothetical protein